MQIRGKFHTRDRARKLRDGTNFKRRWIFLSEEYTFLPSTSPESSHEAILTIDSKTKPFTKRPNESLPHPLLSEVLLYLCSSLLTSLSLSPQLTLCSNCFSPFSIKLILGNLQPWPLSLPLPFFSLTNKNNFSSNFLSKLV